MRRYLPGGVQREVILVPREDKDRRLVEEFSDWYGSEPTWIDWALGPTRVSEARRTCFAPLIRRQQRVVKDFCLDCRGLPLEELTTQERDHVAFCWHH